MSVMAGIIAGLIIGWVIEWIIDWRFWRSGKFSAAGSLDGGAAVDTSLLENQLQSSQAEIDRLQEELAASAELDAKLTAAEAKLADTESQVAQLKDEAVQLSSQDKTSVAGSDVENTTKELQGQLDVAQNKIAELESAEPDCEEQVKAAVEPLQAENAQLRQELNALQTKLDDLTSQPDDLKQIHGIGPAYEEYLNQAGIRTYQQLAQAKATKLAGMVGKEEWQATDMESWIEQAKELAEQTGKDK